MINKEGREEGKGYFRHGIGRANTTPTGENNNKNKNDKLRLVLPNNTRTILLRVPHYALLRHKRCFRAMAMVCSTPDNARFLRAKSFLVLDIGRYGRRERCLGVGPTLSLLARPGTPRGKVGAGTGPRCGDVGLCVAEIGCRLSPWKFYFSSLAQFSIVFS